MTEKRSLMDIIIGFFSFIPMIMYMIVAVLLTIIAAFSLIDAILLITQIKITPDLPTGLIKIIQSLLLTITIIVLFETVTVYFRTKHVEVRALLIAGITGMVRHILIFNVSTADAMQMFASVALLAVLIAGVVLVKPEP
jgi:uncharacterized membrane protein (DUF373 family)